MSEHGGKRVGAGRKQTRLKKPIVMRVPAEYERAVRDLIAFIDNMASAEKGAVIASDPLFVHTDTTEIAGGSVNVSFKALKVT